MIWSHTGKVKRFSVSPDDPSRGADGDGPASGFPAGFPVELFQPERWFGPTSPPDGSRHSFGREYNPDARKEKYNTMNTTSVNRSFGFPIPSLYGEAQRLLTALQDATIAAPVIARLPATFVADFAAQVALVAQHGTDQSSAKGMTNALTLTKGQAALAYRQIAAYARRCAVLAYPGQGPLLRSEFSVGVHRPQDLHSVLDRARTLLTAVQTHATDLAPHGWIAADATALADAIDALEAAGGSQSTAADVKLGATAQLHGGSNALYKMCRAVQHTAGIVYPAAKVSSDPTIVAVRARFLLDEFPTRFHAARKSPAAPAASVSLAPVVPVAPATVPAAA